MTPPLDGATTRSINVADVAGTQHVVHGVYGLANINGCSHRFATFTWTAARPQTVELTVTDTTDGDSTHLYLAHTLLRTGGTHLNVKVDYAHTLVFIVFTGVERSTWMSFNRQWVARFLDEITTSTQHPHSPEETL